MSNVGLRVPSVKPRLILMFVTYCPTADLVALMEDEAFDELILARLTFKLASVLL